MTPEPMIVQHDDRAIYHRRRWERTERSETTPASRTVSWVRLIDGQTRSLPAVAELLGFSAQSALARAARGLAEASRNGGSKSL